MQLHNLWNLGWRISSNAQRFVATQGSLCREVINWNDVKMVVVRRAEGKSKIMGTLESRCSSLGETAFTLHLYFSEKCSRSQKSASLKSNLPSELWPIFGTRCQTMRLKAFTYLLQRKTILMRKKKSTFDIGHATYFLQFVLVKVAWILWDFEWDIFSPIYHIV